MKRLALLTVLTFALAACGGGSEPPVASTPTGAGTISANCVAGALALADAISGATSTAVPLETTLTTLREITKNAASAIKADVELVASAIKAFHQDMRDAGLDPANPAVQNDPQAAQAAGRAAAAFQATGAPSAVQRIGAYFDTLCPGSR
jgi:hypothetical protein